MGNPCRLEALDVTNPRAVFVWMTEAREALDDLAVIAADACRPSRRRRLSRRAARDRYRRARTAMAWLFAMPLATPAPAPAATPADRFEGWAE